ncbi:spermine oxidase-like [Cimex lectularius]|uniref:Amine oxidase domain-containing protein n=1 Tax=Cimex lectularius TaxID=79782 RepID=A0A8I6RD70_CIMLE|nr:spermine oxidase-like [Cimex lectularius]
MDGITPYIHTYSHVLMKRSLPLLLHSFRKFSRKKEIADCKKVTSTCQTDALALDPKTPQPKVVIVGAGMAGLSAAQRLSQSGFYNYKVLEATDRPGGRIHSCWLGDAVGEIGAQWINGGSVANPIFTLACVEGLLKEPLSERTGFTGDKLLCLTSDGRAIEQHIAESAFHIFKQIKNQAYSLFSIDTSKSHGHLKNFITKRIKEELVLVPEDWRYDVSRVLVGLANCIKTRWGEDLNKMSSDLFGSFIDVPGNPVRVPLGFVGVLGPLLRDIPTGNIIYCKEVESIKWDTKTPRAIVRIKEGNDEPADFVIVTVSLGVLKNRASSLFHPPLQEEKQTAINNLGYGHLNKIILEYAKPFWAVGEGLMCFAWTSDELEQDKTWVKGISTIEELPGSQNMLMTSVGGQEAIDSENCSDEEVADAITTMLRRFTGDSTLPYPLSVIRSKWSTDKNFMGAVTYMGLESSVANQCDLATPAEDPCSPGYPILLFAGEATAPGLFSTVQGARISGVREAERILKLTKKLGGPPAVVPA